MKIHFLGTNGWFDSPLGNTISTLIDAKNAYIILDAGFGFAKVKNFIKTNKPVYLFISHLHLDHICGLHGFCGQRFPQGIKIISQKGTKKYLNAIFSNHFSMPFGAYGFPIRIKEIEPGQHNKPFKFSALKLKHANKYTLGYRLEIDDKIIAYCCDTGPSKNVIKLARNADLLIHECALPPGKRYPWGHSSPEITARMAKKAAAKKLILTHFSSDYYDSKQKRLVAEKVARKIFPNAVAARDGLTITV